MKPSFTVKVVELPDNRDLPAKMLLNTMIEICGLILLLDAKRNVDVVRQHPQKALQDLSMSVLLDSSVDNISCLLQRGKLYSDLARQVSHINAIIGCLLILLDCFWPLHILLFTSQSSFSFNFWDLAVKILHKLLCFKFFFRCCKKHFRSCHYFFKFVEF